ncbi:hypothetical protein [Streptomyces resistomycificus]|uniref:hypothetical protein n=1 Tax=Streptomyces resistomycificus TaxID=67356 RepID=UPI0013E2D7D3|nr:hypothetical protein [Streptomyces resistomycificus]
MSRIAFSRVGTRQLRGEKRPPLEAGVALDVYKRQKRGWPSAPNRAQGRTPLRAAAG